MKSATAGTVNEIDRWDGGAGWISHPDEQMQRASHALATDEGLLVVDPVDAEGLDDWLADLAAEHDLDGVAGVAVLLDRHKRDSAAVATRHDVPVGVPSWMSGVAGDLDAPVEPLGSLLADTTYELRRVIDNPFWQEAALYQAEAEVLVTPEVFGTVSYYCAPNEDLGVHPMLRITPPRKLRRLDVDRLLVGHGEGVPKNAGEGIRRAIRGATRNAPKLYLNTLKNAIF